MRTVMRISLRKFRYTFKHKYNPSCYLAQTASLNLPIIRIIEPLFFIDIISIDSILVIARKAKERKRGRTRRCNDSYIGINKGVLEHLSRTGTLQAHPPMEALFIMSSIFAAAASLQPWFQTT
jgi:hypothetical protein